MLATWFQDCGVCGFGASGIVPLSPSELYAWANGTQRTLDRWQFQALLDASRGYCAEHSGNNREAPDGQEMPRQDVGSKLKSIARMVNKT